MIYKIFLSQQVDPGKTLCQNKLIPNINIMNIYAIGKP